MNLNTLFHQCLYFCIVIVIFSLCLSFISWLWFDIGAIPIESPMGIPAGGNANETFGGYIDTALGFSGGFGVIWLLGAGIGGAATIGFSILTGSTSPVAAYLFGAVFWTAYLKGLSVLNMVPSEIKILFTVPIIFVFCGAIIAILGYNG